MNNPAYEETADELTKRILALIPDHPEIITFESPWDLFGVAGFKCNDLGPSMFQAAWALRNARQIYHNRQIQLTTERSNP